MRLARLLALATALVLVSQQAAIAGAPLKGVDVKLGKNPGGSPVASRVTDAAGNADFGVPPKGDYTLNVAATPGAIGLRLVIVGPAAGTLERDIAAGAAGRAAPVLFSLSGNAPLKVSVTTGGRAAPGH